MQPGATDARRDAEALYAAKEVASSIGRAVEPAAPAAHHRSRRDSADDVEADDHEPGQREYRAPSWLAMRAHDVDGVVAAYSDRFVYDDRRRLSGDPIEGSAGLRAAV